MPESTIFSGSSRYASDFQQIIERSLAIANLPKRQLEQQQAILRVQATAVSSFQSKVASLRSSLDGINAALTANSFAQSSSASTVARANLSSGATVGTYGVQVESLGAKTSNISLTSLPDIGDPSSENITSETSISLTANGATHAITLQPGASLNDLAAAINAATAAEVEATVVNVAAPADPADYRLSLQSKKYNTQAITLTTNAGTVDLLDQSIIGSPVTYRLNGYPVSPIFPLESDTRTLNVAAGTTIELLSVGTTEISVSRSASGIATAISGFVSAYNAVVAEVDNNRGTGSGELKGSGIVASISDSLRRMLTYSENDTDSFSNITDMKFEFSQSGQLSFAASDITALPAAELEALIGFLGKTTTGGLLKFSSDVLAALDDSTDGLLASESESLRQEIERQGERIEVRETYLARMQEDIAQRMSAADALIASLERQVVYYRGMFEAMRVNSY